MADAQEGTDRDAASTCSAAIASLQGPEGVWVFAYGSLMWRPDFPFAEACRAHLGGWHRAMCILSTQYRGTPQNPGLVLGLDRGGSCIGRAFRVEAERWIEACRMLHAREMLTGVYRPRFLRARLDDGRKVPAYAFIADRTHRQYWRGGAEAAVALIRQGVGEMGSARDYLANTVRNLDDLGLADGDLHRLLRAVDST